MPLVAGCSLYKENITPVGSIPYFMGVEQMALQL